MSSQVTRLISSPLPLVRPPSSHLCAICTPAGIPKAEREPEACWLLGTRPPPARGTWGCSLRQPPSDLKARRHALCVAWGQSQPAPLLIRMAERGLQTTWHKGHLPSAEQGCGVRQRVGLRLPPRPGTRLVQAVLGFQLRRDNLSLESSLLSSGMLLPRQSQPDHHAHCLLSKGQDTVSCSVNARLNFYMAPN